LQFISDSAVEALGAFIGFGLALWLYYHQKSNDSIEEKKEKYLKDKSKVNYLKIQLEAGKKTIKRQIDEIEKNNKKISKNAMYLFQPNLYPTEELLRIQKLMDNPEYYDAYSNIIGGSFEQTKKYRNIMASNDYFLNQFNELKKTHAIESDHQRKLQYKALFDQSLKTVSNFGESHETSNPDLYNDINQILHNYLSKMKPELIESQQLNFVDPSKRILLDKYYEIPGSKECLELLKNTTQLYSEMQMQNESYLERYIQMHKLMTDTYFVLKENSIDINKSYS